MRTGAFYSTDIRYVDIERKIFRIKDRVSLTAEISNLMEIIKSFLLNSKDSFIIRTKAKATSLSNGFIENPIYFLRRSGTKIR